MTTSDRADRGFLRSAGVVSLLTLASRVLGMLRDMGTAHLLGGGAVNDALTYAWTVPNAFRRLFGEGALSAAFVPVFTRVLRTGDREHAARVARTVISTVAALLVAMVVLLVGLSYLVPQSWWAALFGGQSADKVALTLSYTRLLLPYLVAICIVAQFMAVLNTLGEFAVPAFGPAILNIVWLLGIAAAAWWGTRDASGGEDPREIQGFIIVGAILFAAMLQFAWHLPALASRGVGFRLERPRNSPELSEVVTLMGPMLLGMGCAQLNIIADRTIAMAQLEDGGTTHLYYGLRLMQFPLGLVSVALVTTVFPALTRLMAAGDRRGAAATAGLALRTNALIAIPAAVGLAVLARPIVSLLFESGEYVARDVDLTSDALLGYALGIPFAGTAMLLTRASYAAGDVALPVRVGLAMVVVNVGLDLVLVGPLGEFGLGLATSLTALLTALGLAHGVARQLQLELNKGLLAGLWSSILTGLVLGAVVYGVDSWVSTLVGGGRVAALARVTAGLLAGGLVFLALAPRISPAEWGEVSALWRRGERDGGPE